MDAAALLRPNVFVQENDEILAVRFSRRVIMPAERTHSISSMRNALRADARPGFVDCKDEKACTVFRP
jgi:hypothetical protein